jgi:hypothetical protein
MHFKFYSGGTLEGLQVLWILWILWKAFQSRTHFADEDRQVNLNEVKINFVLMNLEVLQQLTIARTYWMLVSHAVVKFALIASIGRRQMGRNRKTQSKRTSR